MRIRRRLSSFLAFALVIPVLSGCDGAGPVSPPDTGGPPVSAAISDGAHGGLETFYFLPPMVGDPGSFVRAFNGSLSPVVEICDPAGCDVRSVATFDMTTGPGSETIRVVPEDEHYIVNWHTDEFEVSPGDVVRVNVEAFGDLLGYADVEMAASGQEARNLTTGDVIGLQDGRTLPIKFRIEEGAAAEAFPVTAATGGTVESTDGEVTIEVAPTSLATDTEITVEPVDATGDALTAVEFGPDGLEFTDPVIVTLAYDAAALPAGVAETDLALTTYEDGEWIVVPESTVDPLTGTVTAPLYGFSRYGVGPANRAVFCPGDGNSNTFESMTDAVAAVVTDGTVAICAGTHAVEGVLLTRGITFEPKGSTTPVLQASVAGSVFMAEGLETGTIVFDGITLEILTPNPAADGFQSYAVRGRNTDLSYILRNATVSVGPTARGGMVLRPGNITPTIEVENSTITGGVFGITAIGVDMYVRSSQVVSTRNVGLNFSGNTGRVENTVFTDCGAAYCVRTISGANVEVVNNTFTPHVLTGQAAPDVNEHVYIVNGASTTVSGNDFQGCGYWQCIEVRSADATITGNAFQVAQSNQALADAFHAVIRHEEAGASLIENNTFSGCHIFCVQGGWGASVTVRNNQFDVPAGSGPGWIIHGRSVDPSAISSLTIEDNTIQVDLTGVDMNDPGTFHAQAGIEMDNAVAVVNRNTIVGAARGVIAHTGGQVTAGEDNVIDSAFWGLMTLDASSLHMQFNDITNFTFSAFEAAGASSTSDLRCNWWGSGADPVLTADGVLAASVVTPVATAPIAGTNHSGCVP